MTYFLLNLVFLTAVAVVAFTAVAFRRRPGLRAAGAAALVVFALTVVFDNVMIFAGLVAYDGQRISGARLGLAPVEDFAYALAAVVLLPSLWALLGRGRKHPDAGDDEAAGPDAVGDEAAGPDV